jgi:hypothetical protein
MQARFRRLALATLGLSAFLAVTSPAAFALQPGGKNDRALPPNDRPLYDTQVDEISLWTDSYATVTKIVVVTANCAFRGDARASLRRNVNRLGFTRDIPLIGQLFVDTPRRGDLNPGNQIGFAYLDGETLYVDARFISGKGTVDRTLLSALSNGPTAGVTVPFAVVPNAPPLQSVSVVNRDYEFVVRPAHFTAVAPPGMRCGNNALSALPSLGPLFGQPLGTAHLVSWRLIVLVRPSIIAGD